MSAYRAFVEDLKGLVDRLLSLAPDRDMVVPMVHLRQADGKTDGLGVDPRFFEGDVSVFIDHAVLPYIDVFRPTEVGWTFISTAGDAVVVAIDRERVEVWTAPLGPELMWTRWLIDAARGRLITPIQKAMR